MKKMKVSKKEAAALELQERTVCFERAVAERGGVLALSR